MVFPTRYTTQVRELSRADITFLQKNFPVDYNVGAYKDRDYRRAVQFLYQLERGR